MVLMEGFLNKWTNMLKGWQLRWFVLDDDLYVLNYYETREDKMRGALRSSLPIKFGTVIDTDKKNDSKFIIRVKGKTFYFKAPSTEECKKWTDVLNDTTLKHRNSLRRDRSPEKDDQTLCNDNSEWQSLDTEHFDNISDVHFDLLPDETKDAVITQASYAAQQVKVKELERQLQQAKDHLKAEESQYQQIHQTAQSAEEAAQRTSKVSSEATAASSAQYANLVNSKQKVTQLEEELQKAKEGLKQTEDTMSDQIAKKPDSTSS